MKENLFKICLISSLFIFSYNVNATCNDEELNDWAEKVEIKYQVEEETDDYYPEFSYVLLNSSYNDKVVMKAIDNYSSEQYIVEYDEHYKTNAIGSYIHFEDKTYKIEFYGSESSLCPNELLRTIKYTVPSFNDNVYTEFCDDEKNKDNEICQMNAKDKLTTEEFNKKVEEIKKEEKENTFGGKVLKFISNYWYYIVIPFVLVTLIYLLKVYIFKKEQKKK